MRIRYGIAALVAGLVAGVYETAVWGFVPLFMVGVHPIVPSIALLILYEQPQAALLLAVIAGVVSDVFVVDAYHFLLGCYVLMAILLASMAKSVFTNRSLYAAIAICVVGRFFENAWLVVGNMLHGHRWSSGLTLTSVVHWWSVPAWDIAIILIAFMIGLLIRHRMRGARGGRVAEHATWYG